MSTQDPQAKYYSFRTGQSNNPESEALDAALTDVVEDVAQSLQDEELMLQAMAEAERRRQLAAGLLALLLAIGVAVVILFYPRNLRSVKNAQVAPVSRPSTPEPPVDSKPPTPIQLETGNFRMRLPRGYEWDVRLVSIGEKQYRMISQRNLNMLGIYQQQGNRLVILEPDDERLTEFQWVITSNDYLELIAEPPARKTGANYLGTTLTRALDSESPPSVSPGLGNRP